MSDAEVLQFKSAVDRVGERTNSSHSGAVRSACGQAAGEGVRPAGAHRARGVAPFPAPIEKYMVHNEKDRAAFLCRC